MPCGRAAPRSSRRVRSHRRGHGGVGVTETDPFLAATYSRPLGDGTFVADLDPDWSVAGRPHGGYLLALLCRAATHGSSLEPMSVNAQFLRSPKVGPVLLRLSPLKTGRLITVVRVTLEQRGLPCVDATVSLGELPTGDADWSESLDMPVNPPTEALDVSSLDGGKFAALSKTCDVRLDPRGAGFLSGDTSDPPRLRLWARPRTGQPDLLFALVAGDITMPVTVNLGRFGWAPTVALSSLLRTRPANGWLRLAVEAKAVHGPWFDEDTTVIDSTGRLICQARQLALSSIDP